MRYGILIPYLNRLEQLRTTLRTFLHHYGDRHDWRVLLVLDPKEKQSEDVRAMITDIGAEDRCLVVDSPGPASNSTTTIEYNYAASIAETDFLIITNPECAHQTDILSILDGVFAESPDVYIVCACESVGHITMLTNPWRLQFRHVGWYQHSQYHNQMLNFCTAISAVNYDNIGGFDNDYAPGLGYADNAFIDAVIAARIPIVLRDDALTLHQEHLATNPDDRRALVDRNKRLYSQKQTGIGNGT